ncbi:MAG: sugar phosphate nucleotidyltransferase [Candidatus Gracilibacteria bacterium]
MKGVILAGGTGSRLTPLTKVTNKHLLPIYNKPMIYYPLLKLKEMGVNSILLISGKGHAGHFLELLGAGTEFGVNIAYEVQEEARGIAQALSLAKDFVGDEKFVVMLGDNIFQDSLEKAAREFEAGTSEAHIFLKEVEQPQSYGVPRLENGKIVEILEKPVNPPSPYAVSGCYLFTPGVFEVIRSVKPSSRGEMEITDVNDYYVKNGTLTHTILSGFWGDCGESIDHMMGVARFVQENMAS